MSLVLLSVIFILAMFHKGSEKSLMFVALSFFSAIHYLVAGQIPGADFGWYYISSASLLFVLSKFFNNSKDHSVFHLILASGILCNLSGYVLWDINESQKFSSLFGLILYCYTIIILISDRAYDQGNSTALSFSRSIYRWIYKSDRRYLARSKRKSA